MSERDTSDNKDGLLARHPRLTILLIGGVAYVILIGMCLAVLALAVSVRG